MGKLYIAWSWTEIVGILPPGSRVHAMSSVGTTVYFMGDDLAPNSPVVHCNMAMYSVRLASYYHKSLY